MKIDIYTSAQTIGQKEERRTACAMVMTATAPDGRVQVRKMAFPLGTSTLNLAGLQAVRLAALGLRQWVAARRAKVNIFTDSHYALEMLAKEGESYKADPKTNVEVVSAMREWCDKLPGLTLHHQKADSGIGNGCLVQARDLATSTATSQTPSDGGTKEFPNGREAGI